MHGDETSRDAAAGLSIERIVFFSDAVIAIAITLLAIDLKLPEGGEQTGQPLAPLLSALAPRYLAFVISFAVIAVYWIAHHRMFRFITAFNGVLLFLNMLFLFFVVQLPFLASVLGTHGNLSSATALYALGLAAMGFSSAALWMYAVRKGLARPDLPRGLATYMALRALIVSIIFLASIPIALFSPAVAQLSWIAIVPAQRILARRMAHAARHA
jgi:uncharacterized membrane protein